jgi:hypothetical protein
MNKVSKLQKERIESVSFFYMLELYGALNADFEGGNRVRLKYIEDIVRRWVQVIDQIRPGSKKSLERSFEK